MQEERKACIVIKKTGVYEFYHNDRSKSTSNSIFDKSANEINTTGKEAEKMYKEYLKEVEKKYREIKGQKLQKNVIKLFSSVVVLNEKHQLDDVKRVAEYLEKSLDTKVFQVAIHRDEGYIKNGQKHVNYHAHIIFAGLDHEGKSVRKKLTRYYLSDLQDKVAKLLNMPRGIKNSPRKHMNYKQYKQIMKEKEKLEISYKAKEKELEIENKLLHAKLQKIEEENKELRMKLILAEATAKELRKKMIEINKIRQKQQQKIIFLQKDYKELSNLKKQLNITNVSEILQILKEKEKKIKELKEKLSKKQTAPTIQEKDIDL